jgi:hypothetical protein
MSILGTKLKTSLVLLDIRVLSEAPFEFWGSEAVPTDVEEAKV